MNRAYLARKGFFVNGIAALLNLLIFFALFNFSGKGQAFSFGYGALVSLIFSLSWFLLSAPFMDSPYFIAAAMGGFFFRSVFLVLFFYLGLRVLNLHVIATAVSFLLVRGVLITSEIVIGFKLAKRAK
jgi:hypothetical protein